MIYAIGTNISTFVCGAVLNASNTYLVFPVCDFPVPEYKPFLIGDSLCYFFACDSRKSIIRLRIADLKKTTAKLAAAKA